MPLQKSEAISNQIFSADNRLFKHTPFVYKTERNVQLLPVPSAHPVRDKTIDFKSTNSPSLTFH